MDRHLAIELGVHHEVGANDVSDHDLRGLRDRKVDEVKGDAVLASGF